MIHPVWTGKIWVYEWKREPPNVLKAQFLRGRIGVLQSEIITASREIDALKSELKELE